MLQTLRVPLSWTELAKRTYREAVADNCLGLAAQLAYYFFLALFPALLFFVALISFIPVEGLLKSITDMLGRVAPTEVLTLVQDQIVKIAQNKDGGREKKKIGVLAEREWLEARAAGRIRPAVSRANCDVDADLPPARPPDLRPRTSDWVLGGLAVVPAAAFTLTKVRNRLKSHA